MNEQIIISKLEYDRYKRTMRNFDEEIIKKARKLNKKMNESLFAIGLILGMIGASLFFL